MRQRDIEKQREARMREEREEREKREKREEREEREREGGREGGSNLQPN